jgi:hypothetical protein
MVVGLPGQSEIMGIELLKQFSEGAEVDVKVF